VKKPSMVDITAKNVIVREAEAYGRIRLKPETIKLIREGRIEKGDPLQVAAIAGILAAKQTPNLLPMCHPIELTKVDVNCYIEDEEHIACKSYVKAVARTGVEMEALTAAAIALLNVWDMVKKYEKDERGLYPYTIIEEIRVLSKVKHENNRLQDS
jgi:cyclic pyranopterin phosphate synthase